MRNQVEFKVRGRFALFTDPLTRVGGEKCSYHIPTYEAVKGILHSIYWKPTLIWHVDKVRIMNPIKTQSKGIKPIKMSGGNSLAIYTYLQDVGYQIQAHFEWNMHRPDMAKDRIDGKHYQIAKRMIDRGGRRDIFLGTRECQGYVEPCVFGEGRSHYQDVEELAFGLMFHGYDYPDETGVNELHTRFWMPKLQHGIISFIRPDQCAIRNFVREMIPELPESVGVQEPELLEVPA